MNNSDLFRMTATFCLSAAAVITYLKIEGNTSNDQEDMNSRLMGALEECIAAHKTKPEINVEVSAQSPAPAPAEPIEHAPLVAPTKDSIDKTFVERGTQTDDGRYELSYGMCTFIYDPATRRIFVKGDDYRCFCDQVLAGLAGNPLEERCEDAPVNLAVASRMPEPVAAKDPEYGLETEEPRQARESAAAECKIPFDQTTEDDKSWNWQYAEPEEDEERIPTWRETFGTLENGIAKK